MGLIIGKWTRKKTIISFGDFVVTPTISLQSTATIVRAARWERLQSLHRAYFTVEWLAKVRYVRQARVAPASARKNWPMKLHQSLPFYEPTNSHPVTR